MEEWGNKRANDYYEANVPAGVIRPEKGDPVRVVERFIRDKYELKKYIGSSIPPTKTVHSETDDAHGHHNNNNKHHHIDHHHHNRHHFGDSAHKHPAAPPAKSAAVATPAPTPVPVVAAPNLLDFMDEPTAPISVQITPVASTASFDGNNFDPFAISSAPAPATQQHQTFDAFSGFTSTPTAHQQPPQVSRFEKI